MGSCSEINPVIMMILVSSSYLPTAVTSPSVSTAEALTIFDVGRTIHVQYTDLLISLYR